MNPRFLCCAWGAALMLGSLSSAHAVEYKQVNAAASQIAFTFLQMGSRVYGRFNAFDATIDFDPAAPAAAHAELSIQLTSIDAGSSDANEELQKPGWFNTTEYPVATFQSSSVKPLGNNRYEVTGPLALKGTSHNVNALVTLKPESDIGVFNGEFILNRADFKVGDGEWSDTAVSNDIHITFRVVAPAQ
jgi:polyisoprenoid-binding protein YceI